MEEVEAACQAFRLALERLAALQREQAEGARFTRAGTGMEFALDLARGRVNTARSRVEAAVTAATRAAIYAPAS